MNNLFSTTSSSRRFDPQIMKWLVILGALAVLFKLWMVGGHDLLTKFRPHDDTLFIVLATQILEGNWLGEYNNKTLIKGVGYPLFLAASSWLGISILTLQHLLYAFVCLLAAVSLRNAVRQPLWLFLAFCLLLYNPMTYTYPLMWVTLRESLYLSLSLWLMVSLLGLWNCRNRSGVESVWWALSLAISLTWLWFTREESIWVMPGLILFAVIYLLPFRWNAGYLILARLGLLLVPVILVAACHYTIVSKNKAYYGVSIANELKSEEFTQALGGLMRIKHEKLEEHVIVSNDAQKKAFRVSPAFAELAPYLSNDSHLPASFYIWELRSAVRKAGYYDDPHSAVRTMEFYRRMGEEINRACDTGELDCYDRSPSITPVWHSEYNRQVLPVFLDLASIAVTNGYYMQDQEEGEGSKEDLDTLFYTDVLTGESTIRNSIYFEDKLPNYYRRIILLKRAFMDLFGNVYHYLVPILCGIALLMHGWRTVAMLRNGKLSPGPVFGLILLGSIFTILCLLTFVKITIWPVFRPLHTVSPLILLYIVYTSLPAEGTAD